MECNLNLSSLHNVSLTSSTFVFTGEDGESTSVPFADTSTDQILCVMLGGPKQIPDHILYPVTIIYILMFIMGVIGNVAVCLVIVHNKSMHTATNYYLFSLAISDLIILILGLPNELIIFWHQYPYLLGVVFCKFRSFASELASYASVLTIVSFSVERYLAICHPLHVFSMGDFQRAVRVISFDWLVAGLAAIPYLFWTDIGYINHPGTNEKMKDSAYCAMEISNIYPEGFPVYELSAIVFFVIPAGLLMFLYISMAITLHLSMRGVVASSGSVHGERQINSSRKQIIRMLAVVVLAFFICWLPFHAQRLGYVYFLDTKWFRTANEYFTYLTGICYYVSSTINPIVYNVMSAKYRAAFRKTLCGIQPGNGLQNNLTLHKSAVGGDQSQLPRYGQVQRNRRATVPMTEETSMQPQPHNVMIHRSNGTTKTTEVGTSHQSLMMNGMNEIDGNGMVSVPLVDTVPKEPKKHVQIELQPLTILD